LEITYFLAAQAALAEIIIEAGYLGVFVQNNGGIGAHGEAQQTLLAFVFEEDGLHASPVTCFERFGIARLKNVAAMGNLFP
jgi:hypothetical protein